MAQGDGNKLRLMVVDDEPDNLDLLYRTFRRDFQVFRADSAPTALQILDREGEMAIIISDQRMPEMHGTEFLSKTVEPFPDTIRIVLTGYTDVEDLVEAINSGKVFKYITKPWNPDNLKAVVQQAADTYRVVKQKTNELRRSLRRESLLNTVMTAIRESLDYYHMLQTIVATLGQTFEASYGILCPIEDNQLSSDAFSYQATGYEAPSTDVVTLNQNPLIQSALKCRQIQLAKTNENNIAATQLVIPFTYQQDFLAVLYLYQAGSSTPWSSEEIELIEGVAEQAALAISQAKLYQRIQEQSEQMRSELAVARQIQSNLLRQSWPELDGIKVQACCYPAREVGGDFFEVYVHPQGDIWLAVGDVSGKGVPAALFMASAISVLRRELSQEVSPEPDIVMQNLNNTLLEDLTGTNCFITMVLARYTPTTHQLVYANAGHIYPLVWSYEALAQHSKAKLAVPAGSYVDGAGAEITLEPNYLKVRGVPLGILPIWKAKAGTLVLNPGEVLLLTSDGITEATISSNGLVGGGSGGQSANSMLQQTGLWKLLMQEQKPLDLTNLLAHVRAHHHVQEDDQTLLSLEVL